MNYRHAYHAGNFADVVKHAVLVPHHLVSAREARGVPRHRHPCWRRAFTILPDPRPSRTGEWRDGIGRLIGSAELVPAGRAPCSRPISTPLRRSIRPARSAVYPGSPALARAWLRPQDRLIACELEPHAAAALARDLRGDTARQGGRDRRLDRAQRLCAAEGAARPGADRSAVRAAGRIRAARARAGRRAPQMADRHLPALVPDQGRTRGRRRSSASSPGSASRKCCGRN